MHIYLHHTPPTQAKREMHNKPGCERKKWNVWFCVHSSPTEILVMPIWECLLPPHNLWGRKNVPYFSDVSMFDLGPMKFYSLIGQKTHWNVCISYCSVAVLEYHDQKQLKKNLFGIWLWREKYGIVVEPQIREIPFSSALRKWEKRENRKWEEAINPQSPSPVMYFL